MRRKSLSVIVLTLAIPSVAHAAIITSVPATATSPAIAVYVAKPHGDGTYPAVLLLHGCEGFNGFEAVAADRLAMHGYVAAAIDELGPRQPDGACGGERDGSIAEAVAARATLAWLRTQPYVAADRLGIIGFSMGGNAALNLIDPIGPPAPVPAGLRVAIAFYPACEGRDGRVTVPLAIFDGDVDQITPAAPCASMVRAGSAAGKSLQITTYPGATHGFTVPGPDRTFFGQPIRYDPTAAADSTEKTAILLAQYLGKT